MKNIGSVRRKTAARVCFDALILGKKQPPRNQQSGAADKIFITRRGLMGF